jgi:acyl-CoA reductase-like NAD-dependent aldehyde dehydrogenase
MKNARIEAARAVNTYSLSAGEAAGSRATSYGHRNSARRRGTSPDGPSADRRHRRDHPVQLPLNLVAHKLRLALAAGCAVVLKPASQTPVSALRLAAICEEAGLPRDGCVLPGKASEIGEALVEDERVRMITFTGSAEVGWGIRERTARKKVALELGNASPVLVEADADLELAASKVATHAFSFAGQTCVSVQRVFARREVYDDFLAHLVPKVEALRVGDPADDATDVGPVIDQGNHDRILEWLEEAKADGAEVAVGGVEEEGLIRPTVLTGVKPEMKVCRQEIFGPVCTVSLRSARGGVRARQLDGVRLQSAIFTRSIEPAVKATSRLEFGSVMINEAPEWRVDQMPYGGTKASGNTKEGPAYTIAR